MVCALFSGRRVSGYGALARSSRGIPAGSRIVTREFGCGGGTRARVRLDGTPGGSEKNTRRGAETIECGLCIAIWLPQFIQDLGIRTKLACSWRRLTRRDRRIWRTSRKRIYGWMHCAKTPDFRAFCSAWRCLNPVGELSRMAATVFVRSR
jgi:hypothetical protein